MTEQHSTSAASRPSVDALRLEVAPAYAHTGGDFRLLVYVNEVEMTSAGAGLGMDPYDIIVPTNLLLAQPCASTVAIARCDCGHYGCRATDVTITSEGGLVHWEWSIATPMNRGASFAATQYEEELARVSADLSWETAERTAGRLVLAAVDRASLLTNGLRPCRVANDYRDHELFEVMLRLDEQYYVFVYTPWHERGPEELARDVCATLALPPARWTATWSASKSTVNTPPPIAGPSWRRHRR